MFQTGAILSQVLLELSDWSTRLHHHSLRASRSQYQCHLRWFEVRIRASFCSNKSHCVKWKRMFEAHCFRPKIEERWSRKTLRDCAQLDQLSAAVKSEFENSKQCQNEDPFTACEKEPELGLRWWFGFCTEIHEFSKTLNIQLYQNLFIQISCLLEWSARASLRRLCNWKKTNKSIRPYRTTMVGPQAMKTFTLAGWLFM